MGSFKAPTLRNIELTAPYMHDGSIATLDGVLIDHYGRGGRLITDGPYAGDGSTNPFKSGFIRGFTLTDQEKQDVLNFLKSLTDTDFITNPHFSDPFTGKFCTGDCNLDRSVTVDELITAVNVALESCAAGRLCRRRSERRRRGRDQRADRGSGRHERLRIANDHA